MVYRVLGDAKEKTKIARCHNASLAALRGVLETHLA